MNNLIKFLFTIWIFGLCFSCKTKNLVENTQKPFIINMDFESIQNFLFLTNQDGEIVYKIDKIESFDTVHVYGLNENDILDLTVGYSGHNVGVMTFRNIKSNFIWSLSPDCSLNFLQGARDDYKYIKLTVKGINNYDDLIYPQNSINIDVEKNANSLVINSSVLYEDDVVISILAKNETEYKSFLLKNNKWSEFSGSFQRTINFNDFETPVIHEIIAPKKGDYSINVEMIDSIEGVSLLKYFEKNHLNKNDAIRFFLTPDMSIEQLRVKVWIKTESADYFYNKISTQFPETLEYYDPNITINASEENFDFFISKTKNFTEVKYTYGDNNFSQWNIYQKISDPTNYTVPIIPEDILAIYPNLKQLLTPNKVSLSVYEIDSDLNAFTPTKFIFPKCESYLTKTIFIEL